MTAIWDFIICIWNAIFGGGIYVKPGAGLWRGSMFFPHMIYGSSATPPWPGNSGVDSILGYAGVDGEAGKPWYSQKILNSFAWIQAMGADTLIYISEGFAKDSSRLKLLCDPSTSGNYVVQARKYGIKRWVVSLFNDGPLLANREPYVKMMCEAYAWADKNEVAWLIGLETNETMSVAVIRQIIGWLKQYGGGKRILIGSASASFLKQFSGDGVELWAETDWHPFQTTMQNAPIYLNKLVDLQKCGKTWAGEWGRGGAVDVDKFITQKAIALGMDCGSGYYK